MTTPSPAKGDARQICRTVVNDMALPVGGGTVAQPTEVLAMTPIEDGGALCIGVDVGGTFTDGVLTDATRIWRAKAPTTPDDLGRGVLYACQLVSVRAGST